MGEVPPCDETADSNGLPASKAIRRGNLVMKKLIIGAMSVVAIGGLYAGPASATTPNATTTECTGTLTGTYDRIVVPDGRHL